ncbi:hypothetical protein [Ewingella americana]|uniref:Uncharacterized protein n=1 Tax=Ewingella americana TaxID=41202 RepID=A0A502GEH3_9GAMM|nr:hypothetical protein [Ewingella americana]TPG60022.1 hypothetical protein EAH77_15760 [Ewingella americana]
MENFYSRSAQYLLGPDYSQVRFDIDTEVIYSEKELPKRWLKLLKLEEIQTPTEFLYKGPNYFAWILARMAIKAALETNDLAFLEFSTKSLIINYEKQFFEYLKERFPEDIVSYTTASFTANGLCYARISLFAGKEEDHRDTLSAGIVIGIEGSRQYVEVSYTSADLWDYYFGMETFSIQEVLTDSSYNSIRNLLLISLKA